MSDCDKATTYCQECNQYVKGDACAPDQIAHCPNQDMRLNMIGRTPDSDAYYANDDAYL